MEIFVSILSVKMHFKIPNAVNMLPPEVQVPDKSSSSQQGLDTDGRQDPRQRGSCHKTSALKHGLRASGKNLDAII